MITHKTTPLMMIAVLISRARVGASSRFNQPTQSESIARASRNVAFMRSFARRPFDDRNGGRAHPEKILIWIFYFDAHRESLRDTHPVQFAFHNRHSAKGQIGLAFGLHGPSNSLDASAEALVRRG